MIHAVLAALALSWAAAAPVPPKTAWRQRIESIRAKGRTPLVDLSSTFDDLVLNPGPLARRLDLMGIAFMGVSCELASSPFTEEGEDWQGCARRAGDEQPAAFIPLPTGDLAWAPHMRPRVDSYALLDSIAGDAQRGAPAAGPVRLWAFPYWIEAKREAAGDGYVDSVPPEGEIAAGLFAIAERTGMVLQVVGEADDDFLPAFDRALSRHPRARVIWARAGRVDARARSKVYSAAYVRGLLDRHPNLYLDLSSGKTNQWQFDRRPRDLLHPGDKSGLAADWKDLIETHPWRFLSALGLSPLDLNELGLAVMRQRAILSNLSPEAREIVAYKAAWKLLFDETL